MSRSMTSYTIQEAFDTMVNHLRRQGKPSQITLPSGTLVCAYRGVDGCACAVGALIPDDQYDPQLECHSLGSIFDDLGFDVDDELLDFLCDAQNTLHDAPATPVFQNERSFLQCMEIGAKHLAVTYNLIYTPPIGEPA